MSSNSLAGFSDDFGSRNLKRSASQELNALRDKGIVPKRVALEVLQKVNLLRESNAITLDIGGSLTKLMYLQQYSTSASSASGKESRGIDHLNSAARRTKKLLIDQLDGSRPTYLAVDVPILNGVVHFFTFETRYIEECVHFISRHWHTFHNRSKNASREKLLNMQDSAAQSGSNADPQKATNGNTSQVGSNAAPKLVRATGGGAFKYADLFLQEMDVKLSYVDEMASTVAGLNFLVMNAHQEAYVYRPPPNLSAEDAAAPSLDQCREFLPPSATPFPYLLVNIGSGVSIVHVTGPGKYERVSGSSLGGGTFWGLSRLLTNCKTFDEVIELTKDGQNENVDMMVGDIYGGDYGKIGLSANVIAASFGKVSMKKENSTSSFSAMLLEFRRAVLGTAWLWLNVALATPVVGNLLRRFDVDRMAHESLANGQLRSLFKAPDVALSLLRMVSYNIGQIAFLNAKRYNLQHVYFGGNFIRDHPFTVSTLSFAVQFWSDSQIQARFLVHDGYLGAVGAFLNAGTAAPDSSRHSHQEPNPLKRQESGIDGKAELVHANGGQQEHPIARNREPLLHARGENTNESSTGTLAHDELDEGVHCGKDSEHPAAESSKGAVDSDVKTLEKPERVEQEVSADSAESQSMESEWVTVEPKKRRNQRKSNAESN
uniref:Pantothenate kinase n=1 Tax=Timspurckia oligopyrenoides TaxID=708627 RepID=A0A7S0ZF09_9RHOD|mmetsp:Transcript_2752/g.4832  ORF Transcript_2752/g.4832 Transcript_2752/m.4832 type:complete len:659 (+) Transcript_2752:251-2227(+)